MIQAGRHTIVVADSSKFGHRTLAKVASLDEIQAIITDTGLPDAACADYGDKLLRAPLLSR